MHLNLLLRTSFNVCINKLTYFWCRWDLREDQGSWLHSGYTERDESKQRTGCGVLLRASGGTILWGTYHKNVKVNTVNPSFVRLPPLGDHLSTTLNQLICPLLWWDRPLMCDHFGLAEGWSHKFTVKWSGVLNKAMPCFTIFACCWLQWSITCTGFSTRRCCHKLERYVRT